MLPLCPGWNSRNWAFPGHSAAILLPAIGAAITNKGDFHPARLEGEAPNEHQRALCVSVPRGWGVQALGTHLGRVDVAVNPPCLVFSAKPRAQPSPSAAPAELMFAPFPRSGALGEGEQGWQVRQVRE